MVVVIKLYPRSPTFEMTPKPVGDSRGDCEDYASRLGDIFEEHIMNLFLNVFGLITNRNFH